jgi:hypothetical protein
MASKKAGFMSFKPMIAILMFLAAPMALVLPLSVEAAPPTSASAPTPAASPFSAPTDVFIYAYPGTTCPGGSERYKGPEQTLASDSGAVYCRFKRTVLPFAKSLRTDCPAGMKPHAESRAKPDDDVIWCEKDPNPKVALPSSTPKGQ